MHFLGLFKKHFSKTEQQNYINMHMFIVRVILTRTPLDIWTILKIINYECVIISAVKNNALTQLIKLQV